MTGGGPWGSSGGPNGGNGNDDREREGSGKDRGENKRPHQNGNQIPPEIEEIVKKGQEKLRILVGGKKGWNGGRPPGGGGDNGSGGAPGFKIGKVGVMLGILGAAALWSISSFYTVQQNERSVELLFGKFYTIGNPGLNFAPWPIVKAEIVQVTNERQTDIGTGRNGESGLMLTRDQNIVDIGFQVVWNVADPSVYLFNLADPSDTIRAVSESAMRDIIARSELSPILNRDRGAIAADVRGKIQKTLDSYNAGINIIRVNFEKADPPREVIDAFREVQAAQQKRDRLEKEADAYANRVTAGARGEAARLLEESEAYRARVVNDAQGEASRFLAVYNEYIKAPDVTRERMYLETMERVLGSMDKIILDGVQGADGATNSGVIPVISLNEQLKRTQSNNTTNEVKGEEK